MLCRPADEVNINKTTFFIFVYLLVRNVIFDFSTSTESDRNDQNATK